VSAQNRPRLYWFNIPRYTPPNDKQININSVINFNWNEPSKYIKGIFGGASRFDIVRHIKTGKSGCLMASMYKGNYSSFVRNDNKVHNLTPNECELLQTVPINYTSCVSNSQRYTMLGNGWTVDVIAHIFKNIGQKPKPFFKPTLF
jgi:site-specific DNA-cytosine methylase